MSAYPPPLLSVLFRPSILRVLAEGVVIRQGGCLLVPPMIAVELRQAGFDEVVGHSLLITQERCVYEDEGWVDDPRLDACYVVSIADLRRAR